MRKVLIAISLGVLAFAGVGASVAVATNDKVIICHNTERGKNDPDPPLRNEIEVSESAVDDHVRLHGDTVGRCGQVTVTVTGPTTTVTLPAVTVPGPTTTVTNTVTLPGQTVTVEKEVPGPERVVTKEIVVPQYVNVPVPGAERIVFKTVTKTVKVPSKPKVVTKVVNRCVPGPRTAPRPDNPPVRPREVPYTP